MTPGKTEREGSKQTRQKQRELVVDQSGREQPLAMLVRKQLLVLLEGLSRVREWVWTTTLNFT